MGPSDRLRRAEDQTTLSAGARGERACKWAAVTVGDVTVLDVNRSRLLRAAKRGMPRVG